jgi:hypothetical protein
MHLHHHLVDQGQVANVQCWRQTTVSAGVKQTPALTVGELTGCSLGSSQPISQQANTHQHTPMHPMHPGPRHLEQVPMRNQPHSTGCWRSSWLASWLAG